MDVQVVSSQGQSSGVKTDSAFLPRILLSGFLLVSVVGDSAFPGLQTSVRRGTGLVLCAESCRAEVPSQPLRWSQESCWGPVWVLQASVRRGASPVCSAPRAAVPATRVALATRVVLPLGIFCSVSDQNLSESVASSSSLRFD